MTSKNNLPISAGISGIIEVSATHWLDRIKTKQQELMLTGINKNLYETSINIYKCGGLKGLYVGILPRIIGIIPMRIAYWTTLIKINTYVENYKNSFVKCLMPGLIAGFVQTLLDNPIEVIKIKLMTKKQFDNNIHFDLKKLYVGFVPTVIRNSIFAISVSLSIQIFNNTENKFYAGAFGGLIGSFISQPFDVIKTELQRSKTTNQNNTTFRTLLKLGKNPYNLWKGGSLRSVIAFLNMGIGFYSLNFFQKII